MIVNVKHSKITHILFGVCISMGLFEITLQTINYKKNTEFYEWDKELIYKLAPHKELSFSMEGYNFSIATNADGLRDIEIPTIKKKEDFRILCLGDSSTFGWGVEFNNTWAQRLEHMLNKQFSHRHFKVINAGVPGYTSFQGLQYLKQKAFIYRPDIIIVSFGRNDIDSVNKTDKETQEHISSMRIFLGNLLLKSKAYSLLRFLGAKATRLLIYFDGHSNVFHHLKTSFDKLFSQHKKPRVPLAEYAYNLAEIIKICRHQKVELVFLDMGWRTDIHSYNEHDDISYLLAMDTIGNANNIAVVEFSRHTVDSGLFLYDNVHPNARGHAVIARELIKSMINLDYVPNNTAK